VGRLARPRARPRCSRSPPTSRARPSSAPSTAPPTPRARRRPSPVCLGRIGRRRLRQRARRVLPRQLKTELIADRVWRTRSQLGLAVVEYVGRYNGAPCTRASTTDHRSSTSSSRRCEKQLRWPEQACDPPKRGPVEPGAAQSAGSADSRYTAPARGARSPVRRRPHTGLRGAAHAARLLGRRASPEPWSLVRRRTTSSTRRSSRGARVLSPDMATAPYVRR
jgi:hypothetical protein